MKNRWPSLLRTAACCALIGTVVSACGGGSHAVPVSTPSRATGSAAAANLPFAVPPPPPGSEAPPRAPILQTTPAAPDRSPGSVRRTRDITAHPAFFAGEVALSNGVYYLQLPNGNVFGYYSYLSDPRYIYHQDAGYFFVADAADGKGGVYLYDFASQHWWYTSPAFAFPYLYDFSRNTVVYYYPDAKNAGRYTVNPRYFYDFAAGAIITLPGPKPVPSRLTFAGGTTLTQTVMVWQGSTLQPLTADASACAGVATAAPQSYGLTVSSIGPSGSCNLVVIDPSGGRSTLPIYVTTAPTGTVTQTSYYGGSGQENLAADGSGNLWFTALFGDQILRRAADGTQKAFALATGSHPEYITLGPNGNMWFTEYGANKVGFITPFGTITEFTLPNANTKPSSIVLGPDGALWFTEAGYAAIGRITTAGAVFQYPAPMTAEISGITVGPDNNLWYTAYGANKIVRVTTAGVATGFSIPTSGAGPSSITPGPDGALWFTETDGQQIGRVTVGGSFTEYARPSSTYDQPSAITAGPDGNLWYTVFQAKKIGRITPAGYIDEFPLPTPSFPDDIIKAPDGTLWFTLGVNGFGLAKVAP